MNRRGFLGSILALGAAPAIVRADSLMRIVPSQLLVETDALLSYDRITREALRVAHEKMVFLRGIEREFGGSVDRKHIRVRLPTPYGRHA